MTTHAMSREDLLARIRILSRQVWEERVQEPDIEDWLSNFDGSSGITEDEQDNALHLLAQFNHFGIREIRVLLRSLYRDQFRYPIVQNIRERLGNTTDTGLIAAEFQSELQATRFLGMGNPSESGSHLLYYFRQENQLSKDLFVHQHQLMDSPRAAADVKLGIPGLKRVVFIDDVLGSGQQAGEYSNLLLSSLQRAAHNSGTKIEVLYCVLFAKPEGLAVARGPGMLFDEVRTVHELDSSECAFSADSHVYANPPLGITLAAGKAMSKWYGEMLFKGHGLGYRDAQLLLGLHHNVPDNTLPIFWSDAPDQSWRPIFRRHTKV